MKNILFLVLILALSGITSFVLVLFSLLLPSRVESEVGRENIHFGLPIYFVEQDQSEYDYLGNYPRSFTMSFDYLDYELPTRFIEINFYLSLGIVWIIIIILMKIVKNYKNPIKKFFCK